MRVAIAGFMHETNTFAPSKATFEMFERADSWPGLAVGDAIGPAVAGVNVPMAGFLEANDEIGFEIAPLLWCSAGPSAHVTDDAFERIAGGIVSRLEDAGAVDAVYLDLHGAMVTESFEDGEGELLERVRRAVGPDTPVVASLDLHANVTQAMFRNADALVGFRTYPHVDMAETGARAARLLAEIGRGGQPAKAMRRTDFLVSINWQCTLVDPAKTVYERLAALERAADVAGVSCLLGFPPADIAECGPVVVAYGADQPAADRAADALLAEIEALRDGFDGALLEPEAAVAEAMRLADGAAAPVLIADTQDNPGGGGDGDTTGLLRALAAAAPEGAVFGLMIDAEAAAEAHAVGVGGAFDAALGGRSWHEDSPMATRLVVEALGDGAFTCTGPFYLGAAMQLGPMARVRIEGTPVRVVLASRKVQAADQEMFRHVGIEPAETRILALKSSVHYRADFGPIASGIVTARAPGPVIADPADLPYANLRDGVRLGPNGPVYRRA